MLGLIRRLRRFRFRMAVNLYSVESVAGALKMGLLFRAIRARQKTGQDRSGFGLAIAHRLCEQYGVALRVVIDGHRAEVALALASPVA